MLTTQKRLSNMAEAFVSAAAREAQKKKVNAERITVAPELTWVTRRIALTEGNKGQVTERSGMWLK